MTLLLASNIDGGDMFLENMEKQGLPVCPFIVCMVKFKQSPPPHPTPWHISKMLEQVFEVALSKGSDFLKLGCGCLVITTWARSKDP